MRTNERFEALFDIRHDFIKHSSNVQTLYIELYLRPRGLLPPLSFFSSIQSHPPPSADLTSVLPRRLRTLSTQASYVLLSAGAAYNENIVLARLVMPQYRIMYNYITQRGGREEVAAEVKRPRNRGLRKRR